MIREDVPHACTTPPEFRQRAVALARQGDSPVARIAKDLGISESCLWNWMAQADVDDKGGDTRLSSSEKKEIAELRRRNKVLEQENEILKKAAAFSPRRISFQNSVLAGP